MKSYDDTSINTLKERHHYKTCLYCRRTMLPSSFMNSSDIRVRGLVVSIEHKIPRSHGGGNERSNLLVACQRCNSLRGHLDYDLFFFFSKHIIHKHPDLPNVYLRGALVQFITRLAELAVRNTKECLTAIEFAQIKLKSDLDRAPETLDY